jgi:hypothetical protein
MQWSTDIRQIKAAIFDQAFIGNTWVSWPLSVFLTKGYLDFVQCEVRDTTFPEV